MNENIDDILIKRLAGEVLPGKKKRVSMSGLENRIMRRTTWS